MHGSWNDWIWVVSEQTPPKLTDAPKANGRLRRALSDRSKPPVCRQSRKGGTFAVPTNEVHLGEKHECDEANIGHVARHSVLPEEAEQVILNDPVDLGMEIVEGEERYLNLGATVQHRILLVVTTWREDRVRVVTAFEPIKRLIQLYYQERER